MGDKVTRYIERSKLDAIAVALYLFKHTGSNALCGLAPVIAGIHAVDIGIVHGPEAFANVHGIMVDRWDHQNFIPLDNQPLFFKLFQCMYQLGADIQLLDFIAAHGTHNADGFFSASKPIAGDIQRIPIRGWQFKQCFLQHFRHPPRFRLPEYVQSGNRNRRPDIHAA